MQNLRWQWNGMYNPSPKRLLGAARRWGLIFVLLIIISAQAITDGQAHHFSSTAWIILLFVGMFDVSLFIHDRKRRREISDNS